MQTGNGDEGLVAVGERLRQVRTAGGQALSEAASAMGVRVAYLEALENSELHRLMGPTYVEALVARYAFFLGLDPDDVLASAAGAVGRSGASVPVAAGDDLSLSILETIPAPVPASVPVPAPVPVAAPVPVPAGPGPGSAASDGPVSPGGGAAGTASLSEGVPAGRPKGSRLSRRWVILPFVVLVLAMLGFFGVLVLGVLGGEDPPAAGEVSSGTTGVVSAAASSSATTDASRPPVTLFPVVDVPPDGWLARPATSTGGTSTGTTSTGAASTSTTVPMSTTTAATSTTTPPPATTTTRRPTTTTTRRPPATTATTRRPTTTTTVWSVTTTSPTTTTTVEVPTTSTLPPSKPLPPTTAGLVDVGVGSAQRGGAAAS